MRLEPDSSPTGEHLSNPKPVDWLDKYMAYTAGMPTPDIYRLWSGITALSGALERRVWVETGKGKVYPNLYVMLVGYPAIGKCLHPDEMILNALGEAVRTGDVKVGDQLLGPDGKPRRVLNVVSGTGPMYRITPTRGRSWICNGDHILSLKKTKHLHLTKPYEYPTVEQYLKWGPGKKSEYKLQRTGVGDLGTADWVPEIDPYFVGVMLGDGSRVIDGIEFTSADFEIVEYCEKIAHNNGLYLKHQGRYRYRINSPDWRYNPLLNKFREYHITDTCGNKQVPPVLKTGCVETRLQLLAGLIDTDGSYVINSGCYDFISKSKKLAEDVAYLARSVGLGATVNKSIKTIGRSFTRIYWRVIVSGDVYKIPCKIKRKKALVYKKHTNAMHVGFTVQPIGEGNYYGFTVDGDNQYLLDDFTIIHNSQAVTPVKELWVKCGKFLRVAPDNVTKPALIDLLQRNSRWITEGNPAPSDMEYHCTLLPVPEFGVLMSRHDLEFISVLNYIYDNPPNYREERRTMQGVNPDITNPQLVMLAGAQPDFLASVLPEEAWGMGFCSRIIMIYGSETPQIDLFGAPLENSDSLRDELVADLMELAKDTNYGRMQWQPAAKAALELWYKAGMPPQPNHARLLHYTGRRILQCIKLITISAMARGGSKLILESDVERAKGWLIAAEKVMPDIFRAMLTKNDAELLQELHFSLWRQWATVAPADRKPVPEEAVYNFLSHRIPSEKIAKIIEVAEKSGLLVHNAGGGWIPKPFESLRG